MFFIKLQFNCFHVFLTFSYQKLLSSVKVFFFYSLYDWNWSWSLLSRGIFFGLFGSLAFLTFLCSLCFRIFYRLLFFVLNFFNTIILIYVIKVLIFIFTFLLLSWIISIISCSFLRWLSVWVVTSNYSWAHSTSIKFHFFVIQLI